MKTLEEFIHHTIQQKHGDGIKIEALLDELRLAVGSKKIDPLPFYIGESNHSDRLIDLVEELGYQTLHYSGGCFIHQVYPSLSCLVERKELDEKDTC